MCKVKLKMAVTSNDKTLGKHMQDSVLPSLKILRGEDYEDNDNKKRLNKLAAYDLKFFLNSMFGRSRLFVRLLKLAFCCVSNFIQSITLVRAVPNEP